MSWKGVRHGSRKNVLSKEEALQELKDNSGKQFDPGIVEIFLKSVI